MEVQKDKPITPLLFLPCHPHAMQGPLQPRSDAQAIGGVTQLSRMTTACLWVTDALLEGMNALVTRVTNADLNPPFSRRTKKILCFHHSLCHIWLMTNGHTAKLPMSQIQGTVLCPSSILPFYICQEICLFQVLQPQTNSVTAG